MHIATYTDFNLFKSRLTTTLRVFFSLSLIVCMSSSCGSPAPTNEDLYQKYFTPFVNAIQPVQGDEVSEDKTIQAFVAYHNKDYAKSENLFFTVYRTEKKSFALFYAAMSQMAQGRAKDGRTILKVYLNNPNDSFTTQAHWYMALSYLKEDKKEDAVRKLKKIVTNNADYKVEAEKLLGELQTY